MMPWAQPSWRQVGDNWGQKIRALDPQVQDGAFSNKSQAVPQLCLNLSLSNFPGSILVQHGATHLQFAEVSLDLRTQGGWRTDMLSHNVPQPQPSSSTARRTRRTRQGTHTHGRDARSCPHCGRTFKRAEHLERHIRTRQSPHWFCDPYTTPLSCLPAPAHPLDTKEKPFVCPGQCGAAFARRDLLTRHQRISLHQHVSESPDRASEPDPGEQRDGPFEADLAAAVSLSGMSMQQQQQQHWPHQQAAPPADLYPMAVSRNSTLDDGPYQQGLLVEPFYGNGKLFASGDLSPTPGNQSSTKLTQWS